MNEERREGLAIQDLTSETGEKKSCIIFSLFIFFGKVKSRRCFLSKIRVCIRFHTLEKKVLFYTHSGTSILPLHRMSFQTSFFSFHLDVMGGSLLYFILFSISYGK